MFDRARVRERMDVLGSDAKDIGHVKAIRDTDFLVDRSMHRDVYVPFSAIRDISGDRIVLNIEASQIDNMGWANPPLI